MDVQLHHAYMTYVLIASTKLTRGWYRSGYRPKTRICKPLAHQLPLLRNIISISQSDDSACKFIGRQVDQIWSTSSRFHLVLKPWV